MDGPPPHATTGPAPDANGLDPERSRLAGPDADAWRRWGPYLSERAWGTVREDYSPHGTAWEALPHDHARSRAYRWNEDGLAGLCDDQQRLCAAFASHNGWDPILKERLFGLTGNEGNHGEDAKELWWYRDAAWTDSWSRWQYAYPQSPFPYHDRVATNAAWGRAEEGRQLLERAAAGRSQGMLANTADTDLAASLLPSLLSIVDHHVAGTRFGIGVDPADGLLTQGEAEVALTWMDARIAGVPVLALDTPSGLELTSGRVGTPCIVADARLTLALPEGGLRRAPEVVGGLFAADTAVPPSVYEQLGVSSIAPFAAGTIVRVG